MGFSIVNSVFLGLNNLKKHPGGTVKTLFYSILPEFLALAEIPPNGVLEPPGVCPCVFGDICLHERVCDESP